MRTTSSTKRRPVKKKFTITNFFQLTSSPGAKKGKRSEDEVCHDLNLYCFEAFVILIKSEMKKKKKKKLVLRLRKNTVKPMRNQCYTFQISNWVSSPAKQL